MADLVRVSLQGTMPSGEEWSVNPCYALFGGGVVTPTEAQAAATAVAALSLPSTIRAWNVPGVAFASVRIEARTLAGALESLGEAAKVPPSAGNGTTGHPFQTAMVSSLRTQHAGASGRGRLYWPATAATIQASTLRMDPAALPGTVAEIATFLVAIGDAVSAAVGTDVFLAVWSRKLAALYSVTHVQMGDIADTQRRRRDTLVEAIHTAVIPA